MKILSRTLLDELAGKASASPRKRAHHTIHESSSDAVQRFIVATERDTYFRPHRHLTKSELAFVLRGAFDVITFDDTGKITGRYTVGDDTPGIAYESPQNTWHTLVAQSSGSAFLEVKEGPYDPATAAEFAPWAPAEGDATVPKFLAWLRTAKIGEVAPS